jgi:hypothetical protein
MEDVAVGDEVVCFKQDGSIGICPVTLIAHKNDVQDVVMNQITVRLATGKMQDITLSGHHLVYQLRSQEVGTACIAPSDVQGKYVASSTLEVGDYLLHVDIANSSCQLAVPVLSNDVTWTRGYYNPTVETGALLVDGLRASTYVDRYYTHAQWHALVHGLVAQVDESQRGIPAKQLANTFNGGVVSMYGKTEDMMALDYNGMRRALDLLVADVELHQQCFEISDAVSRFSLLFQAQQQQSELVLLKETN